MIITSKDKIPIEQCFKVNAGPGAGKTYFLVNHIKNVIQNSNRLSRVRKVACITYTNTAVNIILNRLGSGITDKIDICTIHSFLYRNIIKPYVHFIAQDYDLDYRKINEYTEFSINKTFINEWLNNDKFNELKSPNTKNQIRKLPDLNQELCEWLLTIKCICNNGIVVFKCNSRVKLIKKNNLKILSNQLIELKKIYWRNGNFDYNDILFFSVILINKYSFILEILRAKYPYIFLDEYQDTNCVQSYIIDKIREKETIVGVIGDKAQSIYSFQGASPILFDNFKVSKKNDYTIKENHRSSKEIVTFLNIIRKDIKQISCIGIIGFNIVILVGNPINAYKFACDICNNTVVSLSRKNITSNAMKKEINNDNIDEKLYKKYLDIDSCNERRNIILSFMQAIELSKNNNIYKESIKKIEWIYKKDDREIALNSLLKMINIYDLYKDDFLMKFYELIRSTLNIDLTGFKKGKIKNFYENILYKSIAIHINIVDDESDHITIHKAKGSEYNNVMIIQDKSKIIEFLLNPDLNEEEHRIIYVAMSRAKNRLFIHFNELSEDEETQIREKYEYIDIIRL